MPEPRYRIFWHTWLGDERRSLSTYTWPDLLVVVRHFSGLRRAGMVGPALRVERADA